MLANVDTDVIIRIERLTAQDRAALGRWAFEALRYQGDGSENPAFILNQPLFRHAPILIAGPNFGCGSSREGAVWALSGLGVRCVIAESYGDIFFSNCFQNGLLAIRLPADEISKISRQAADGAPVEVDLRAQLIRVNEDSLPFEIDARRRESLLEGLDDIGLTLKQMDHIREWQARDRTARQWVWSAVARDGAPAATTPFSIDV
jgi:3-isopropylmalate/(R)-2-methylmalate dehydratase small subunit